jgi:hypothetical protein
METDSSVVSSLSDGTCGTMQMKYFMDYKTATLLYRAERLQEK